MSLPTIPEEVASRLFDLNEGQLLISLRALSCVSAENIADRKLIARKGACLCMATMASSASFRSRAIASKVNSVEHAAKSC